MDLPLLGFGTYQCGLTNQSVCSLIKRNADRTYDLVSCALATGFRHLDTAAMYLNEKHVGQALHDFLAKSAHMSRKQVFVTSKLPINALRPDKIEYFVRRSLHLLQLEYLDLYLIHAPFAAKYHGDEIFYAIDEQTGKFDCDLIDLRDTWKAMERLVHLKLVRHIGVSNFNKSQLELIMKEARIMPFANQIECNVTFQNKPLVDFCLRHNIKPIAFAPLGSPSRSQSQTAAYLNEHQHLIQSVAGRQHTKHTNAQVMLAFLRSKHIAAVVGADNEQQVADNWTSLQVHLDGEQLKQLEQLDTNRRSFYFDRIAGVRDHPEYPFERD